MNEARLSERWRCALRKGQYRPLTVSHVRIDLQIRPIVRIGGLPLLFVALKLTAVANERRFRRQSQHLRLLRDPVVVHALGVFGVTHKARDIHPSLNLELVANDTDHRDPFARPFGLFKDLIAVGFDPFDAFNVHFALANGLQAQHFELFSFR